MSADDTTGGVRIVYKRQRVHLYVSLAVSMEAEGQKKVTSTSMVAFRRRSVPPIMSRPNTSWAARQ